MLLQKKTQREKKERREHQHQQQQQQQHQQLLLEQHHQALRRHSESTSQGSGSGSGGNAARYPAVVGTVPSPANMTGITIRSGASGSTSIGSRTGAVAALGGGTSVLTVGGGYSAQRREGGMLVSSDMAQAEMAWSTTTGYTETRPLLLQHCISSSIIGAQGGGDVDGVAEVPEITFLAPPAWPRVIQRRLHIDDVCVSPLAMTKSYLCSPSFFDVWHHRKRFSSSFLLFFPPARIDYRSCVFLKKGHFPGWLSTLWVPHDEVLSD
jgi:hypothetical protein